MATDNKTSFAILIPARYSSSRFPGKPLAKIAGKEMILRVIDRVKTVCDNVIVATDDQRIYDCVASYGARAVMTSSNHSSGTDRIREAVDKLDLNVDVIINVQGDEPFIDPNQISSLMSVFKSDSSTQIATLVRKFDPADGFESLFDPNLVKVAVSDNHEALYFSRSIIPYVRTVKYTEWLSTAEFYTHIGIYAYRTDTLRRITSLPRASLEVAESLEQLRWLQNGYPVKVAETDVKTIGIDTPDDLKAAEEFLSKISD